jgi:hypothetical protein
VRPKSVAESMLAVPIPGSCVPESGTHWQDVPTVLLLIKFAICVSFVQEVIVRIKSKSGGFGRNLGPQAIVFSELAGSFQQDLRQGCDRFGWAYT